MGRCPSSFMNENPAELSFISDVPLCLSELTGYTLLLLQVTSQATTLNLGNINNSILKVKISNWYLNYCHFCLDQEYQYFFFTK